MTQRYEMQSFMISKHLQPVLENQKAVTDNKGNEAVQS